MKVTTAWESRIASTYVVVWHKEEEAMTTKVTKLRIENPSHINHKETQCQSLRTVD